ncbi:hypothetical protein ABZ330_18960 [Streptomyces sp. NPDC006172]|uniref:hypothetical protein n=1 Tax=Streptomyces sp. NPDC006172 TaxID=3154470 RepID=UPI003402B765
MGIESDQVVYEFLSRVGDVAQQRQLSSATRMRLVSDLRNEIDKRRAKSPVDSPAAVRRILDRLGSPDDLVAAAAGGVPRAPEEPAAPSVPVQRDREGASEDAAPAPPGRFRRVVPRPRQKPDAAPSAPDAPSPPHRAGAHELGGGVESPDWWRRRESSPFDLGDEVPGFVGGVEIPDMLKPPPPRQTEKEQAEEVEAPVAEPRRRLAPLPRGGSWNNPLLLLAAGCLVAGAVAGSWLALIVGWLIAYASRRLTERETKWAVMVLPGLAVVSGVVWLWGRTEGRWGEPIADGHLNDAIQETFPWVVRGAAVASALFLVWRSQRRK